MGNSPGFFIPYFFFLSGSLSSSGFPGGSDGEESAQNGGDATDSASSLGQEDPLEKEMALFLLKGWNPLQDSCLETSMDRGACVTIHKSQSQT